jgi:RNA polymerase subunit RPABC4/transcription elongation factor Spt4
LIKDFLEKNLVTLTNIVATQKNFSSGGRRELLKTCRMCGYIMAAHWNDNECPGPNGSALSESMFVIDNEMTQVAKSIFEFLGGKL